MSVSGVRNSWEMLVKKRSFDWFGRYVMDVLLFVLQ